MLIPSIYTTWRDAPEIAEHLGLSTATVDSYRKSICSKLGVSGTELVRQAVISRCLPAAS